MGDQRTRWSRSSISTSWSLTLLAWISSSSSSDRRRDRFFLRCLYLVVGDAVRTDFHTASRAGLEDALERAGDRARDDVALVKWVADSRTLIARPETFDYSAWCEGGLAREALAVS